MRVAAFIDGPNLHAASKAINIQIDYARLLAYLRSEGDHLVRAFYYTALLDTTDVDPLRPLIDYLDYNGYAVVTKIAKQIDAGNGRIKIKGNMDIELAMDMIEFADNVEHIFLFSGDGDFRRVIEGVQRKGVTVTVISTRQGNQTMLADELRRQADLVIDIADIAEKISKLDSGGARMMR